uniref:N-acetyltransferase domain-containing protein n=1 Tax=Brassica campestris TaxID=3711 RepID=M4DFB0_BRACM
MSTISIHRTELLRITHNRSRISRQRYRRTIPPWRMMINSRSSDTTKKDELSVKIPQVDQLRSEGLRFDRLQPPEHELFQQDRLDFGKFVAREAILDEEYWTAAWLRAESHWEDRANERYVDNFKRKFAEQEFNAIKRRCKGLQGQKCSCIVAVKKEEKHIKRSVIKSVVGTLDLNIRFFLQGETFPGEKVKSQLFCTINREGSNRYGYIANLCVAKSARRQGIACNMLRFAVESARSNGVEQVYVHVHRNNLVAQELYQKTGFEVKQNIKFITLKIDM